MGAHGQKGLDSPHVPRGQSWPGAGSPQSVLGMHPESPGELSHPLRSLCISHGTRPIGALGVTGSMWVWLDRWKKVKKTSLGQHFLSKTGTEKVYLSCI